MGLELALDAGAGVGLDEASASIVATSSGASSRLPHSASIRVTATSLPGVPSYYRLSEVRVRVVHRHRRRPCRLPRSRRRRDAATPLRRLLPPQGHPLLVLRPPPRPQPAAAAAGDEQERGDGGGREHGVHGHLLVRGVAQPLVYLAERRPELLVEPLRRRDASGSRARSSTSRRPSSARRRRRRSRSEGWIGSSRERRSFGRSTRANRGMSRRASARRPRSRRLRSRSGCPPPQWRRTAVVSTELALD